MKIFLDNSILGRLADLERGREPPSSGLREDMAVLEPLIDACLRQGHRLFVSADARGEIEALAAEPALHQRLLRQLDRFEELPIAPPPEDALWKEADWLVAEIHDLLLRRTRITNPRKRAALAMDARYLAACANHRCDIFLTVDYKSLWLHRGVLRREWGLKVQRPAELYRALNLPEPPPGTPEPNATLQDS